MSFTAYAQLRLPEVAGAFVHLGSLLISASSSRGPWWLAWLDALIAHLAVVNGIEAWGRSVGTGVLWGVSYFFRRVYFPRVEAGSHEE